MKRIVKEWDAIKHKVHRKGNDSDEAYRLWLKPLIVVFVDEEEKQVFVDYPEATVFQRAYIKKHYLKDLEEEIYEMSRERYAVKFDSCAKTY